MGTYKWQRPNEVVKFKGFNQNQLSLISPALVSTDAFLRNDKVLNANFKLQNPTRFGRNPQVAAETRYSLIRPKANVLVSPEVFKKNRYQWNPAGVVSHEIGHLIGPTRNTSFRDRKEFKQAFSYRQKKVIHELAPQEWAKRRSNPLRGVNSRQAVDASEDFAETWRALTGQPFTNRTSRYFDVTITPKRLKYMQENVLK